MDIASMYEAVRQNFADKAAYVARRLPTMRVAENKGIVAVDCGLPSDTFNVIVASNVAPAQVIVDGVEAFIAKRWPMALWYWGATDDPVVQTLLARGLVHTETHVAMAAELATAHVPVARPADLVMSLATTNADLRRYGMVIARLFGPSDEGQQVAAYYNLLTQYPTDRFPALRCYIGTYCGAVVATGSLFVGSNSVGMYDIVTQDEYRRRGIGSAMFAYLLEEAKQFGQRAVLQASPAGLGMYRRAGFTPVGNVHTLENRALLQTM